MTKCQTEIEAGDVRSEASASRITIESLSNNDYGWNKKHKSYFAAASFFICLRRVLPGRGQLWRQSCTNRSPERHSLINCRVQPERANSSLRSSDSARFVAASLTLIIRVVMVRFGLDAVINVGFSFLYFYIINIINTSQDVGLAYMPAKNLHRALPGVKT